MFVLVGAQMRGRPGQVFHAGGGNDLSPRDAVLDNLLRLSPRLSATDIVDAVERVDPPSP